MKYDEGPMEDGEMTQTGSSSSHEAVPMKRGAVKEVLRVEGACFRDP